MKHDDKTRLCLSLPTPLYDRLHRDSLEYGIPKSGIISMLLVEYYKGNNKLGIAGTSRSVGAVAHVKEQGEAPKGVAETP